MSLNAISFWIRSVFSHAYGYYFKSNYTAVKAKAQEVHELGTYLLCSSASSEVGHMSSQLISMLQPSA